MAKYKTFTRDSQGRITSYSFKNAPSVARVRQVIHQAERQGAKSTGLVAGVGQFQGYEMTEADMRTLRDYRAKTPAGLLGHLKGKDIQGSNPANYAILRELQRATGAEMVGDLRSVTINFSY